MDIHKNARLTPKGREEMVRSVVGGGLSRSATARCLNTTAKTVAKWVTGSPKMALRACAIACRDLIHRPKGIEGRHVQRPC
jgi:hypothetical protein